MIHIVFNTADIEVLQKAITLDETLSGEIFEIKDDYAVGPLQDGYTPEGAEARRHWWVKLLHGGDMDGQASLELVNDWRTIRQLTERLDQDETETIWIWAGQNKHDVCGYYWLLHHLKPYQGRILILYLNNLPFINEQGALFYPKWLSHILPKEFLKAKKLARPITASEFELDPDEWTKIAGAGSYVRLLEGGKKLSLHPVEYYDEALKKYITGDFSKASRIIAQFLNNESETTGDMFLLWRLKQMLPQSGWEVKGELKTMKDFEIRHPDLPSRKKVNRTGGGNSMIAIQTLEWRPDDERGKTYVLEQDRTGPFRLLYGNAGMVSGLHHHEGKVAYKTPEKLVFLQGQVMINWKDPEKGVTGSTLVESPAKIIIPPLIWHKVTAETDLIVLELNSIAAAAADTIRTGHP